jgi:phage-related protein
MSTFNYSSSYELTVSRSPRVNVIRFGDGYEQRTSDGINTNPREYNVSFNKDNAEISAIDNFLTERGGLYSFLWSPDDGTPQGKFVCREWSKSFSGPYSSRLSATFVEVYE